MESSPNSSRSNSVLCPPMIERSSRSRSVTSFGRAPNLGTSRVSALAQSLWVPMLQYAAPTPILATPWHMPCLIPRHLVPTVVQIAASRVTFRTGSRNRLGKESLRPRLDIRLHRLRQQQRVLLRRLRLPRGWLRRALRRAPRQRRPLTRLPS